MSKNNIIPFPGNHKPDPFQPAAAVGLYLLTTKCDAVISSRIPGELKRYLMAEAFESRARFSEHIARILATHAVTQCKRCKEKERAA